MTIAREEHVNEIGEGNFAIIKGDEAAVEGFRSRLSKQPSAADLVQITHELQTQHAHLDAELQKHGRELALVVVPDGATDD